MAATDMYVTTTGAGVKSGATWATAMSLTEFETDVEASAEAGDRYFFKEGTYTLTSSIISSKIGTSTAFIELVGVVSATTAEPPTSSDWATGNNRPLLNHNSHALTFSGNYWSFRNCQFASTGNFHGLTLTGTSSQVINCKGNCTGAGAYSGFYCGSKVRLIDCEGIGTNGSGIYSTGEGFMFGCYCHDSSVNGIHTSNAEFTILHCTCDTCGVGIYINNFGKIINNTIYNCTSGITVVGAAFRVNYLFNNVIDNCTDGFKADSAGVVPTSVVFDYNNWSNNTRDMSWDNGASADNSAKGPNDTANAPSFTDAAGGDFSLQNASALIDAGFSIKLGVN